MKTPPLRLLLISLTLLTAAGCASPGSRISRNQAAFDSWPAEVREKVRAGTAGLGFTMEQVRVALGEPARKFTRTSGAGTAEVWAYRDLTPSVSVGVGVGMSAGSGGYGGGVDLESYRYAETMRVVFEHDVVSAIETRKR
jgi:hypothetical protein